MGGVSTLARPLNSGSRSLLRSGQKNPLRQMTPPDSPPHDLGLLVEVLERHGVEYLLRGWRGPRIGYGATRPTEDTDCVVRRERENLRRLTAALRELHARLRIGGMSDEEARSLPVQVDASMLETAGMSTWMTEAGKPGNLRLHSSVESPPRSSSLDQAKSLCTSTMRCWSTTQAAVSVELLRFLTFR